MAFTYKILTQNGVDNTNIDGARAAYFAAGMRDGIIKGSLNECAFTSASSNVINLDSGVLLIAGHSIIIQEGRSWTFTSRPSNTERRAVIAEIVVDNNSAVTFRVFEQLASVALIKNNMFEHENGSGTYQVEIGKFTLTTNGTVDDLTRTIDIITGGKGSGDGAINIGNVTTHTLEAGLEAEVDVEQRLNEEDGKTYTDFNFDIPRGDKGAIGATGVGISTITAGTPTVSGGTTTTPITITLTDNTPIVVNIVAQNGTNGTNGASVSDVQFTYASTDADGNKVYNVMTTVGNGTPFNSGSITSPKGAKGDTGNTGATGIGVSTITAGTPTQSGNTTVTPITVTLTDSNTQSFNVVAQNGANGSNGTNGSNGASVTDVQVVYASTDASGNNIYNVTSTIGGSTVNSGTITAPKGAAGDAGAVFTLSGTTLTIVTD